MKNFEKSNDRNLEKWERVAKLAPSYRDLYPDTPHHTARTQVNAKMEKMARVELGWPQITRQRVPDALTDWEVDMPSYSPPLLDLPRGATSFRKDGDAPHHTDPNTIGEFVSLEVDHVVRDEKGYPLNPMGRTGLRGRGMLDKWGPTEAADAVVTRHNPQTGRLQVLLITRGDTGERALPGGKVDTDDNEPSPDAAGRELVEETGLRGISITFNEDDMVYAGYIDDSRNTDNAWMESSAYHRHLTPEEANVVELEAGDDAEAANWIDVDEDLPNSMLKSHSDILLLALGERPQF